jgi:serine phosphatase RsbU (regulator of sigma subunit)/PAS domain-containing protein/anti-sigma regulatory factor (Ser/Thr protein kinase)
MDESPQAQRVAGTDPWSATVLLHTRQLIGLLATDGTLLDGSDALLTLLGGSRPSLTGQPLDDAPCWRDRPADRTAVRTAIERAAQGRTARCDLDLTATHGRDAGVLSAEFGPVPEGHRVRAVRVDAAVRPARRATAPCVNAVTAGRAAADGSEPLRRLLEATGLTLWTWDLSTDRISWFATSPAELPGVPGTEEPLPTAIERIVHPDDRQRARAGLQAAVAGVRLDLEFRLRDRPDRWLLARGQAQHDPQGMPERITGVLIDVTEHTLARHENTRLLDAERRAGMRATALQRVSAALSEAATCEQVAAVMVEESLRSLGAAAARIELRDDEPITGQAAPSGGRVVRAAGRVRLLQEGPSSPAPGRVSLDLVSRGLHRGRWTLVWGEAVPGLGEAGAGSGRPDWGDADGEDLLRILATECAQALDRAQLYEQQRDIATVLQRTLLPTVLPDVCGAQVAARYQPGGRGVDVGGDWYDVIALPDGRSGLVIGDVEGHSAAAAAVMGQVRNALRAYAAEGSTPALVMERVNRLLVRLRVTQLVTCCYLEFAPQDGTATVVLAGHPPPLLVRPSGDCDYIPAPPNLVLGVDESATYLESTVLLEPGSCLLLYTDGLIETVSRSLPAGLAQLRGWATGWDVEDAPDELVETLIRQARNGPPVLDDVAVLALRYEPTDRRPAGRLRSVRRTLPLDPASAATARRFVCDVLSQWDHAALADPATLMTSELVTNSVLHTSGELELGIYLDVDRLRVEVVDRSERLPALQTPDADAPGGRGLLIIEALADRWGVDGRGDGKAVWFEMMLQPLARRS